MIQNIKQQDKEERKTKKTISKIIPVILILISLMAIGAKISISEEQPSERTIFLSVEKTSYSVGEEITFIITAVPLENYDLSITTPISTYKYSGELKNNIVFFPRDNGLHRVDLISKLTKQVIDSREFLVGAAENEDNMTTNTENANETANNSNITTSTTINNTIGNTINSTNNQTNITNTTNTTNEIAAIIPAARIASDKSTYFIGDEVNIYSDLSDEEQVSLKLYYEYEGLSQRYIGNFSHIKFTPKGIGTHHIVLKNNNGIVEDVVFEVIAKMPDEISNTPINGSDLIELDNTLELNNTANAAPENPQNNSNSQKTQDNSSASIIYQNESEIIPNQLPSATPSIQKPDSTRINQVKNCKDISCTSSYYYGKNIYNENNSWNFVNTTFEKTTGTADWKAEKNIFKTYTKKNKIKITGENNSEISFEVPSTKDPIAYDNVMIYDLSRQFNQDGKNYFVNATLTLTLYDDRVEKLITINNLNLPSDFEYQENLSEELMKNKFRIGDLTIWDSSCIDDSCVKNYYPANWEYQGNTIKLKINKTWLDQAVYPIIIDPTVYYNFTDSTNNKAYKYGGATNLAGANPTWAEGWRAATEATAAEYVNLSTDGGGQASLIATGGNDDPFWRFEFTVNEDPYLINWIYLRFRGNKSATESGYCYLANMSTSSWNSRITMPASNNNITWNLTTPTLVINESNGKVAMFCYGDQFDNADNDRLFADFVEVKVDYTADVTAPTVNANSPANNNWTSHNTPDFIFNYTDSQSPNASCTLYIGTTRYGTNTSTLNSTQTTITANTTVTDGTYNWNITCTDRSGNKGGSAARTITIDTTAPAVNAMSPSTGNITNHNTPDFIFNYTDSLSANAICTLYVGTIAYGINSTTLNNTATTITANTTVTDGNYNWTINCTDQAGNSADSINRTITIDTANPTVNIISPTTGNNTNNNRPNFFFNYTDSISATANCTLYIGNTAYGINSTTTNNTQTNITANTSITEGAYNWNITCKDNAGNSAASSARTITIDTTTPTVNSMSPSTGNITNHNTPDFTFNYTDSLSTTANCTLFVGATRYGINASTLNNTQTTITANATINDGAYNWSINCTDQAGNNAKTTNRTITVDSTAPTVNSMTPSTGNTTNNNQPTFTFNYTDSISANASCTLIIGPTMYGTNSSTLNNTATTIITNATVTDGIYNWSINCTDIAGNSADSINRTITIDTTAPTVNAMSPNTGNQTNDNTPDFIFNYTDSISTTANCTLFVGATRYGTNTSTINNTQTTITANATINDGNYNWSINCTDQAGNNAKTTNRTITIDTTAPTINAMSPTNNNRTNHNTPDFTFNYTDSQSPNASCTLYIGSTAYGTNSSTINNTQTTITANNTITDGNYSWNITCTDNAGNRAGSTARNINIDTTAPTTNAISPANNNWTSHNTPDFTFNYTDSQSPNASCTLYIGSTAYGTNSTTINNTQTTITANNTITDGTYSWNITCTDITGNIGGSNARNINIDTNAPTTSAISPSTGNLTNNNRPNFFFNYTDSLSTTANCTLFIGATAYGINTSTLNNTQTNITANATVTDGNYNWNITCKDLAGNSAASSARTITIDTTTPTVNAMSPANNNRTNHNTPDFTFNYTDSQSANATCTIYVGATAYGTNSTTLNNTQTTITANTSVADGNYSWNITCTDNAGNRAGSTARNISIDTIGPTVNIISPNTGNNTNNNRPNFFFNYTDSVSSTANCTLFIGATAYGINSTTLNNTQTNITANTTVTDGTYSWNITCTDLAGNIGGSNARTITIDTTAPTVNAMNPNTGNQTNDNTPDFIFNYTDSISTTANCRLYVGATAYGINSTTTNNTQTTITANATINDGNYNWSINCTDTAGNNAKSNNRTITIDTTSPTVNAMSPANNNLTNNPTPNFTFNYTDSLSTTASCTVYIGSLAYGINDSTINNTQTNITVNTSLAEGLYNWSINCTDLAGNNAKSNARNITIDTTAPTINIVIPAAVSTTTDTTPDFVFNYTDSASLNASCILYIESTAYGINATTHNNTNTTITANVTVPDGTYSWNITCTDIAGNTAASTSRIIIIDQTVNGYEFLTDDGILNYIDRSPDGAIKYRNWTNNLLGNERNSGMATPNRGSWVKTRCLDDREQCLIGASDNNANFVLSLLRTDSWTFTDLGTLSTGMLDNEMNWDLECEDLSGKCLIAYETDNGASDADFGISTWNGAVLSASTTETITGGENYPITWIKLYPQKGTNNIGIAIQNNGGGNSGTPAIYGGIWNGTGFSNWQVFTTNSVTNSNGYTQHKHFDCAWNNINTFYCAYGVNNNPNIYMYSFNSGTWTNVGSIYSGLGAAPWEISLCGARQWSNFTHNNIGVMACGYNSSLPNATLDAGIWNGATFSKTLYNDTPVRNNAPECAVNKGNAGYGGQNFRCEWENSGSQAIFTWVNSGDDFVRYATYKPSTNAFSISNWSKGNQIVVDGANDVRSVELVSNAHNDEMFLTYTDAARDSGCSYWTGTSWDGSGCNGAAAYETAGGREGTAWASFDWFKYQLQPYIVIYRPSTSTSTDNYSGVTAGSGPSYAYSGTITTLPPNATSSPITGNEFSNACYFATSSSDDNVCTFSTTNASVYGYQSYKFYVTESVLSINSFKIDHEGRATGSTSLTPIDFSIYVYNWSSDSYILKRTVYGGGGADSYTETTLTGGAADYVRNNTMYVLIETRSTSGTGGTAEVDLNTDFISLETSTMPVWSGSQLVNASAYDKDGINECKWAYYSSSAQVNAFTVMSQSNGYYTNTSDTTQVSDGTYDLRVSCNDTYDNRRNESSQVRIDNTAPIIQLFGPANMSNFTTSQITFSWNATDLANENMNCNITIDGSIATPKNIISPHSTNTTANVTGISDGTHYWNVSCIDDAGNKGWSENRIFDTDVNGATITLIYPDAGVSINDRPISLNFSAADIHDISNCSLYLDGNLNNTIFNVTSEAVNNFTFNNLTEGVHYWNVSCTDEYNIRTNSSNRNFTVDYSIPTITLLIPRDYPFNGTVPVLNYSVTDNLDDNLTCNITVNDEVVDHDIPSGNNSIISRTIILSDGNKDWYVTCWDNASNINSSAREYFSVSGGPLINLKSPANNSFGNGYNISFIYNATDLDGVANCSLLIDGSVNQTNYTINTTGNNTFFISDIGTGVHYWNITCDDGNGLAGYSNTRTYTADRETPQISLANPTSGQVVASTPIKFNFTITDSLSPNVTCNLTVDGTVNSANKNFVANTSVLVTRTQTAGSNGVHFWNVSCTDLGGISNISETWNFTVNVTFPVTVLVVADKTTYQEREIAYINVTTKNTTSQVTPANITTDFIYTNNTFTNVSWWNISWPKRKPIFISETAGTVRGDKPIAVNLTVPLGDIWNCTEEIHVVGDDDLVEKAVNIISGDDVTYCYFAFNGSVSAGATNEQNYHVYYGNHTAGATSHPNLTAVRTIFSDYFTAATISANWTYNARWNISAGDPLVSGANHAHIDGPVTDSGIWLNSSLNLSQYDYANLSFVWEIDSSWNASGYMLFQISNNAGGIWTTISTLNGSVAGDLGALRIFNISLNQSYRTNGFKMRFVATTGNGTQDGGFDNFSVIAGNNIQTGLNTSTGNVHLFIERKLNETNSTGSFLYNWNTTSRTYGNYSTVVLANPLNTNLSWGTGYDGFTIIQDIYGPSVTLLYPPTNTTGHAGTYTFIYNATDTGTDIANCSLVLNNVVNATNSTITETSNSSFTVSDMPEGRYNWTVSCYDVIGNQANASIFVLFLDETPPNITLIYPNSITLPMGNITFRFNATDNFDTNLTCNVSVDGGTYWRAVSAVSGAITNATINVSTEATHSWDVTCYDNINNSATSNPFSFTTASIPVLTLDSPPNGFGVNSTDITLNYSVSSSALVNCSLILNGSVYETKNASDIPYQGNNGLNNFTLIGMSYGRYNWTVICFDANNFNATDTTRTFQLDNEPPIISLYYPTNGQTVYTRNINFIFNVTDNVDNNLTCNLSIDGIVNKTNINASSGANTTVPVSSVAITTHNWSAYCVDNTGFNVTSETYNFSIESNVSVSLSSPANNSWDNDGNVNFTYTPQSPADFTPGQCNLYIDDAWQDRHVTVSSGSPKTFVELNIPEGFHSWYINCTDATGKDGKSEVRNLTVDKTNPTVTSYYPNGDSFSNGTVFFNWTATDNLDVNLSCNVYVNGTLKTPGNINSQNNTPTNYTYNNIADGGSVWEVICTDNSTRNATSGQKTFTVQEVPTISLGNPPNGTRTNNQTLILYFTPTDNSGNISSCKLIFDGALNQTNNTLTSSGVQRNFTLDGITEGLHNWTVNCSDPNGNEGTNSTPKYFIIDLTGPNITMYYPAEGNFLNTNNVQFNWTASDYAGTQVNCSLYIDGIYNKSVSQGSGSNFSTTVNNMSDGPHNWSLNCSDNLNNSNTNGTITFTINSPDLFVNDSKIAFNNTNPDLYQTINISINVTNLGGVPASNVLVEFWDGIPGAGIYIGNNTNSVAYNNGSTKFWVLWNITEGYHNIYVTVDPYNAIAELNETNNNATANISALFSNITNPQNYTLTNDNTPQIDFNITDYTTNNINYTIYVDGTRNTQNNTVTAGTSTSLNITTLSDGTHIIKVQATDNIGRSKNSSALNITIDATAPTVIFDTINGTWFNISAPPITFNITDAVDTNINYTIYVNGTYDQEGNATNKTSITANLASYGDGSYNITIKATDDVNNTANYSRIIYIDTALPSINLISPNNSLIINNDTVIFNFTAADNLANYLMCNLTISNGMNQTNINVTNGAWHNITKTGFEAGTHYWNVTCIDQANNTNTSQTWNFSINPPDLYIDGARISFNNTNPNLYENITIRANVSNIGGVNASNVIVDFWDGEPSAGIYLGNATASISKNASVVFNLSWNITPGYHTIYVAVDANNAIAELNETNNNATANISVLFSNITNPQNYTLTNDNTPQIDFNVTDYTENNINYTIYVDGTRNTQNNTVTAGTSTSLNITTLSDGTHIIKVQATDTLGRSKNSSALNITIDTTAPNGTFITANRTFFNTSDPIIQIRIIDIVDNNINYTIYINGTANVTGNATNNTIINVSLSGLVNGSYSLIIQSFDDAGNYANSSSLIIYVDTVPPTITLIYPDNNANFTTRSVTLNFTVSDNLDNVTACNLTLDGTVVQQSNVTNGAYQNYTAANLSEGTHYWNVTCIDNANNTNTSETRSFNVYNYPQLALVAPGNGTITKNQTIDFYFNVSDETGIENCSLLINGAINTTKYNGQITNNATNSFTLSNLNRTYSWAVMCYDNSSMHLTNTTQNWTLTVDPDAPIPFITTANFSWFNTSSPNITFNISDSVDLTINYTFYVNGSFNKNGTVNNNTPASTLLTGLTPDGSYLILLQGTDDANNTGNSTSVLIYVDTTIPSINLTSPSANESFDSTSILFNFTPTDNMASYLICNLTISNKMNQTNINITNGAWQNITKTGFVSGTYYWNVSCVDLAGNRNTSETRNFTINAPDLVITAGNISFNDSNPEEGRNITVYANIYNIGGIPANNITVQFWRGDPDAGGVQVNTNQTISTLNNGENITIAINYTPVINYNEVYVVVDPPTATNGSIVEENESNNKASNSITVGLYQVYAGNATGIIDLEKRSVNLSMFAWNVNNLTGSNIFVTDLEAAPNFFSLKAIGENTTNQTTTNDFTDIDTKLNSSSYSDSINKSYTVNNAPKELRNFTVFGKLVADVPVVNSTNTSNFQTGIVWDTSDGGTEYNATQDLVFITEINQQQQGSQGVYDFEIKVPSLLRNYNAAGSVVAFYTELK